MKKKWIDISEFLVTIGIVICLNILLFNYFFRIDLTEDKRYSLAPISKKMLSSLNDKVYVEVFLDGAMDPDYDRLKKTIKEKLEEFGVYAGKGLEFRFFDPNTIEDKTIRENFYGQLVQKGLQYRYYLQEEGGKKEEKIIFPGAIISYQEKEVPVVFMKGKKTISPQEEVNQAVEGVEFELINGIRKLSHKETKNIAFVEGHGELDKEEVLDVTSSLFEFYNVDRIKLDSSKLALYKALIIASPEKAYSEADKLLLDQYIMQGGNVLFLIDKLNVYKDSLKSGVTYGLPYDLNLDDLLFNYGIRLNPSLVQDKFSGVIRVQTGLNEQSQAISYPLYPVIYNFGPHPIVKNLDAVATRFIGTIDTVKAIGVAKTPLLLTSNDTKVVEAPLRIDLNDLRKNSDPSTFKSGQQTVGYLLEGKFSSLYKNKPLPVNITDFKAESTPAKIIVVSDGDVIRNEFDPVRKKPIPLGFDVNMRYMFSNKDFILNAVDFLTGEEIVNVRGKEVKLRPLDKDEVNESRTKWQVLNIGMPLLFVVLFGLIRFYLRKKQYTRFG